MIISIYLLIALICGILLLVMAAMGGLGDYDADFGTDTDFDVGHGDFGGAGISPLSVPILLAFGALFGSAGVVFEELQYGVLEVPLYSVIVATAITSILFVILVKFFVKAQGTTEIKFQDLIGMTGETTMPTKPGVPGQVMVITEERGRTLVSTVSDVDIPTNSDVKIVGMVGTSLKIVPIEGGE
jgi:membrane-bound ClpP family serine protease